jgi:hypothetical protein
MKCKGTLFILSAVVFAAAPAFAGSQPVPAGHPTPLEKPPKVDVPAPDKDAGVRRAEGTSAAWLEDMLPGKPSIINDPGSP